MRRIVPAGLEISQDDLLGVGLRVRPGLAEQACCPKSEEPVAPGHRFEAQLLVMNELPLEAFLAFVERGGHDILVVAPIKFWLWGRRLAYSYPKIKATWAATLRRNCEVENVHSARLCYPNRSA